MRRLTLMLLVAAPVCLLGCAASTPPPAPPPPTVLMGEVELVCNIDSKANGEQKLKLRKGGGLEFDAAVSPIVDGTVQLKGPDKGGVYKFTSHLIAPARGKLSGVGDIEVVELEAKVSVEVERYQQPGGPGTPFTFGDGDVVDKGAYVEFAGVLRAVPSGERYDFRVNLGAAQRGRGRVVPADSNDNSRMVAKSVIIMAPVATVIQATTTVRRRP